MLSGSSNRGANVTKTKNSMFFGILACLILFSLTVMQNTITAQINRVQQDQADRPNRETKNAKEENLSTDGGFQTQAITVPSGFRLILSDTGVKVYQKDYAGGYPDYVTIVDLRYGTLRNFTGSVSNDTIYPRTLSSFWSSAVAQNTSTRKAKVAINGTFFAPKPSGLPVPIAFGLKADWWRISKGYGINEFPGLVRTLAFDSSFGSSSIQPYLSSTFDQGIPNVVGGLDQNAPKSPTYTGRTFVGVRDDDRNGNSETVLFFSSNYASQAGAANVLSSFGAGSKMMLDGGSSTGLIVNGVSKITPGRTIPQAFIICAGR